MVDDGQIKKVGPDAISRLHTTSSDPNAVPVVKGPLVDYMYVADEEDFFDGEYIVEEGKHGSWIWVILEGVVEIICDTPQGPLPIVRLGDGSFIGSLASFLIQGHIRTATAVAVGNVSLDKRLKQLNERAMEFRQKKAAAVENIEDKKAVLKQGASEDNLYIIREGSASVVRHEEVGRVPLVQLLKGDFFGRIPFLDLGHEPDFASVLASGDLKVSKIDMAQFQGEYNQLSTTFKNFVDNVATCVLVTTQVVCNYQNKFGSDQD
ncbi:MAG: cyclic nucleotide-binding domain-containing protein [Desulfosarcinaceae bacterium]